MTNAPANFRSSPVGADLVGRHPALLGDILLVILIAMVLLLLGASALSAADRVNVIPSHPLRHLDGESVYLEHCAICHGVDGWTDATTARLPVPIPDLATLAQRHGEWDRLHVRTEIEHSATRRHGDPMPCWGRVLIAGSSRGANAIVVRNLVRYIETLQVASH